MQEVLFNLLNDERYSKTTWNNSTEEQKKEILTSFLAEINRVMGTSVDSKIIFEEIKDDDGTVSTRGYHTHPDNTVTINELYLSKSDSYQIMQTMIHEMRHAYQRTAISDSESYLVTEETIDAWSDSFNNYKNANNDGYKAYVSQAVEYDAKNFAQQYSDLTNADPEYKGSWE